MARIKKIVPLTEATYLILMSLVKPLHGYGIMQKIEAISEQRVKMGPGTLYGGLSSLVEKRLIRKMDDSTTADDGDRKKMYVITELGLEVLEKEYLRLKQLVTIGKDIFNHGEKIDG